MDAGEILLRKGLLNSSQLEQARALANGSGRLDQTVVELGFLKEEEALRALGEEVGLNFVDLADADVDLTLLERFPVRFIHRESVFPVQSHNGTLTVATCDPFNLYALDEIGAATGKTILPILASRSEIEKLIKANLGVGSQTIDGLIAQRTEEGAKVELLNQIETDGSELSEMAQEPSVVKLVNEILFEAVQTRASDVHIESGEDSLSVRYRIDGVLHPQPVPPEIRGFRAAIISRLKIMAAMNIAERRLPQDGRIQVRVAGREIDIRMSVIPMIHGEGIVLRLLDKEAMEFSLAGLGMNATIHEQFEELIRHPHGIVLVTGPTGSGKTTTLYSALTEIRSPSTKIITTEDPVEYQLDGISQIQVHTKIGLTFATSLRSILRHDPDIVLVGEIRDIETAENAIQAALTGHMVFSTLHTNDAAGAYTRMADMGVEPYLVCSTVEAVLAQRLVRTLCPHCKTLHKLDPSELPSDIPQDLLDGDVPVFEAVGCRECRNVGYRGRIGIYELMMTTNRIREIAATKANAWDIKRIALEEGMQTLRMDGWDKVRQGVTSVDEVIRVTKGEETLH